MIRTEDNPDVVQNARSLEPPRISIITTCLNRAAFVEETMLGVLQQGYPNLEYIVIDGGSSDGSTDIIRKYERSLASWVSEPDAGEAEAINKGFRLCTGDIVTFNSSDDVYEPGTLRDVAALRQRYPECGVIAGGFRFMDTNSVPYGDVYAARVPSDGPVDLSAVRGRTWRLHQQAVFYTREALIEAGMHVDESLRYTHDRELLYRVCRRRPVALSDRVYTRVRIHRDSQTRGEAGMRFAADREAIRLQESMLLGDDLDAARRLVLGDLKAKALMNRGRFEAKPATAARCLIAVLRMRPAALLAWEWRNGWIHVIHAMRRAV
jgi:glycosyltransferase involved in cell wall biosynthesis